MAIVTKVEHDGIGASVTFDRYDALTGKSRWSWRIYDTYDNVTFAEGDDLCTPAADGAASALRSFLSFLECWAAEHDNGELSDLFPLSLLDAVDADAWQSWADLVQDHYGRG